MSQEIIAQIMTIEQRAVQIHDNAQRQTAQLIEEAQKTALASHEQILTQARLQAGQIAGEEQKAAEAERARIIAHAEAEAQHLEDTAAQHLDRAVSFVLERIAGGE